jgi:hypothetical protein
MTDQEIVDLANRVGRALRSATFSEVCGYIDKIDVVWGVWTGGQNLLIKGEEILRFISASGVEEQLSIGAIPCRSLEEAVALKRCWQASKH